MFTNRIRSGPLVIVLTAFLAGCGGAIQEDVRPNVLIIVADDLGYNDIASFGGDIETPHLDALAAEGLTLTGFRTLPTCSPTRAALLTGSDNHIAGIGAMAEALTSNQVGAPGYEGHLNDRVVTIPTLMRDAGYHTYMSGKWHLGHEPEHDPSRRGFERSFTLLDGGGSHWSDMSGLVDFETMEYRDDGVPVASLPDDFYSSEYYTDRMIEYIDSNLGDGRPFLAYLAYTAPHDPLHAPDEYLEKYRGRYDAGYDEIRRQRLARMVALGLVPESATPFPRLPTIPAWDDLTPEARAFEARRMEAYAAMVDALDHQIGRFLDYLREVGEYENTLIVFFSDNGANGLEMRNYPGQTDEYVNSFDSSLELIGRPGSFVAPGPAWAQTSMTPFRLFKASAAEGGIRVPFFAVGRGIEPGRRSDAFAHVRDLAPTLLELAGVEHPDTYDGRDVAPLLGRSMLSFLHGETSAVHESDATFGWELHGQKALLAGNWKATSLPPPFGNGQWQLFDLSTDPGETRDRSVGEEERLQDMIAAYQDYADRVGVVPPDLDELLRGMGIPPPDDE